MTTTTTHLRSFAVLAVLGLTLGTLAGCSDDEKANSKPSASASPTTTTESPIETAEATPTPTASATAAPKANVADAYPGYGTNSVTTSAPTIPGTWYAGEYVLQNAQRDIQIVMLEDDVRIYSANWSIAKPYGTMPDGSVANGIRLAGGTANNEVTAYTEWPQGQPADNGGDYRDAQVIENGQAIKYGNYICASSDKGVTCWSVNTGRGAFVTANGFTTF